MGEISDYYCQKQMNEEFNPMFFDKPKTENCHVWKTKSGEKIKIKDMTSDHLINAIKYIGKNNRSERSLIILEKECKRRGLNVPKRPDNYRDITECDATEIDIY